jgi:hypothetical protein
VQQVQELEQATRDGFISIQDRQEEQDAVNRIPVIRILEVRATVFSLAKSTS